MEGLDECMCCVLFCVSFDMAYVLYLNYVDRYESAYALKMYGGLVIKYNVN